MYWIDCYAEEGKLFRAIENTSQLNKFLYQNGSIKSRTYYCTKYKLMKLLNELEQTYDIIYEEVHSQRKE